MSVFRILAVGAALSCSYAAIETLKVTTGSNIQTLGKNEQLKSFTVPADSAVNFAFQLVNSAKVLQKNVVLQCDDVFSYYEFTCSDSGSCEAKIEKGKASSYGTKKCHGTLLLAQMVEDKLETTKWNLGDLQFEKVSLPTGPKKMADQREDKFKAQPELLPNWQHEKIPEANLLPFVFIGLLLSTWLIFSSLMSKADSSFSPSQAISSILSHPRVTLMWATLLGFAGFCMISWSTWTILETATYAPAALVLVFGTSLSGLRHLYKTSTEKSA